MIFFFQTSSFYLWGKDSFERNQGQPKIYESHHFILDCKRFSDIGSIIFGCSPAGLGALASSANFLPPLTCLPKTPRFFFFPPFFDPIPFFLYKFNPFFPFQASSPFLSPLLHPLLLPLSLSRSRCSLLEVVSYSCVKLFLGSCYCVKV